MLRHPLTWIAVVGAALMGVVMTSSYIGGLVDPIGHLRDAPIGFVNADAGDAGAQLQEQLTASGDGRVDWQALDSQAEAERRLRDDDLWGAIVVPEGFSAAIAAIGASPMTAKPAELLLLGNEGAGLFQPAIFTQVSTAATTETSSTVRQQLVAVLGADAVPVIGQPVVAKEQAVVALPDKAGRGIAPFYLSVMLTLGGFLAASIVGVGVDLLWGGSRLELFGRVVDLRIGGVDHEVRPLQLWVVKAVPTFVAAVVVGAGCAWLLDRRVAH